MVLNVCDAATQCFHQIALGVASSAMVNGFPLDRIFCVVKRRMKKLARAPVAGLAEAEAA